MSILKVNEIRPRTTGSSVDFTVPVGLKSYTESDRDALTNLSAGEMIFNADTSKVEVYNGSGWDAMNTSTASAGASLGLVVALS